MQVPSTRASFCLSRPAVHKLFLSSNRGNRKSEPNQSILAPPFSLNSDSHCYMTMQTLPLSIALRLPFNIFPFQGSSSLRKPLSQFISTLKRLFCLLSSFTNTNTCVLEVSKDNLEAYVSEATMSWELPSQLVDLYSHRPLSHNPGPFLWFDHICIDQGKILEKSLQVQLISGVYSDAERVTIWLGEADHSGGLTLRCLRTSIASFLAD